MPNLPARLPTPGQRRVLEFLDAYSLLTTGQLHHYVAPATTKRALERLLARMRTTGWLTATPLDPALGNRAEYGWHLTTVGAALLGVAPPARADTLAVERRVVPALTLSAKQQALLHLLARWRQLTTTQIWQDLHPGKSRHYIQKSLDDLRRVGLIRSRRTDPAQGATAEHYWFLSTPGTRALGIPDDRHFQRRPSRETLAFRGLQLDLIHQAHAAGWSVIPAQRYSRAHPCPAETPQSRHLVAAALEHERQAVAAALARGASAGQLGMRLDMLRVGSVGALVPPTVNDYVIYRPEAPHCAAVLIPHPPYATASFWTRPPNIRTPHLAQRRRPDSRVERYRQLSQVLPVLAVFPTGAVAAPYAELLTRAGFQWILASELSLRLPTLC